MYTSDFEDIIIQKVKDPNEYPVSIYELKTYIGYSVNDISDQEYLLEDIIKGVTEEAENYINNDIALTLVTYNFYNFSGDEVIVKEGNYNNFISLYVDPSSLITPRYIFPYKNYVRIVLFNSISGNPLTVKFYTGWNNEDVPLSIKRAILMRCFDNWMVSRGSLSAINIQDTLTFERLLSPYMSTRI